MVSYASNLPRGCTMDIVVPDHLLPLKQSLETFGYKLRTRSRENGRKKLFTSLRLDDAGETLVLAIRVGREGEWKRFTEEQLKKLFQDTDIDPEAAEAASPESEAASASAVTH